jgi:glyoxylase-like metal-dependent hydrolase (beta-lactamase superfamily II)/ferredoxin
VARLSARLAGNAPGSYFVDDSCIDCAMCRRLAPETFTRDDSVGLSVVLRQPESELDKLRAAMALVSCPTSSIGSDDKKDARRAALALPEPLEGDVYFCGYASEKSYGAASYLLRRSAGNVLVDSPRAASPLMDRIEELGGVRFMFLTHKDDVADHRKYAARFGCERIIHAADAGPLLPTGIERLIEGREDVRLADDLLVIPLPGHTRGSMALLFQEKFLFTGDHVWGTKSGSLGASESVAWYSWAEQARSMERLLDYSFEWVLPGHGMPFHARSTGAMRDALSALVTRMQHPRCA